MEIRRIAEVNAGSMETRREGEGDYIVEGYACVYESATTLGEIDGVEYHEIIRMYAHSNADLSDCIFLYNHEGQVLARVSNGSLELRETARGLWFRASLKHSEAAREMYSEIKAGLVDKMSWAFIVDKESYNHKTNTRIIEKIKKVFDISAVSAPAYQDTSIYARNKKKEDLLRELRTTKLKAMIEGLK